MRENVVLINPPPEKDSSGHYDKAKNPRMGLGYLASYLEEHGIGCRVVDAKFEGLEFNETIERVKQEDPFLIGITAMTPEIMSAA
ncbi:unnamed protein product, partial [marine sediment metagenome]